MSANPDKQLSPQLSELATRYSIQRDEMLSFKEHVRTFNKGETIIREGDQDKTLYLLRNGTVAVWKQIKPDENQPVTLIKAVNFFGEMAIINNEPRSATVTAFTNDVLVYAVPSPNVHLIVSNPRLGELLITRLAKDLSKSADQVKSDTIIIAQLQEKEAQLNKQIRDLEAHHQSYLNNVAKVFGVLVILNRVILDEAVVGSRGWAIVKGLNDITMRLVNNFAPEIAHTRQPLDVKMLRSALADMEKEIPKSVYNQLSARFEEIMQKYKDET